MLKWLKSLIQNALSVPEFNKDSLFYQETPFDIGYLSYWNDVNINDIPDSQIDGYWYARVEIGDYNW